MTTITEHLTKGAGGGTAPASTRTRLPAGVPPIRVQRRAAAEALGISVELLDQIPFHELPFHRHGRAKLFLWKDLAAYVERERQWAIKQHGDIMAEDS